jgi:sugar phosphate isomerase/epimerase
VGVCLDTGNSIALLEDPMEVVLALAPLAFTTHFKDMAVEEYRDGFLLSEVPLGTGILDLPRVKQAVRAARPDIRLNLEMITRDPLKVPCLTEGYWTTFPELPGKTLARALSSVRGHSKSQSLPRISQLSSGEQLRTEDENIRRCFTFACEKLGR